MGKDSKAQGSKLKAERLKAKELERSEVEGPSFLWRDEKQGAFETGSS